MQQSHATIFPRTTRGGTKHLLVSKCLKQSLLSYLDAQLLPPEPTIWSCTNGFLVFWMHQKCKVFQRIKHGDQGEFVIDYSLLSYLSLFHLKDCKFWFWVPWTVPCYLRSACKFHKELQVSASVALTASLFKIISIHLANLGRAAKSMANSGPCRGTSRNG